MPRANDKNIVILTGFVGNVGPLTTEMRTIKDNQIDIETFTFELIQQTYVFQSKTTKEKVLNLKYANRSYPKPDGTWAQVNEAQYLRKQMDTGTVVVIEGSIRTSQKESGGMTWTNFYFDIADIQLGGLTQRQRLVEQGQQGQQRAQQQPRQAQQQAQRQAPRQQTAQGPALDDDLPF